MRTLYVPDRLTAAALAGTLVLSGATVAAMAAPDTAHAAPKISAKAKTLTVGKSYMLKVKGIKKKVKWSSTNKKVATVSSKGKVKAKKMGTAKIRAKIGKKTYTCTVKVNPKINAAKKTLVVGKGCTLKLTGATGKIKWYTSTKKVATVSSKGKVKAKKAGTATITAKIKNKKVATCKVTVKKTAATGGNNTASTKPTSKPVINANAKKVGLYDQNDKLLRLYPNVDYAKDEIQCILDVMAANPAVKTRNGNLDWEGIVKSIDKCPKGFYLDKACTSPLVNINGIKPGQSVYLKVGNHQMQTMVKYHDVCIEDCYGKTSVQGKIVCSAYIDPTGKEQTDHILSYDTKTLTWTDLGFDTRYNSPGGNTLTTYFHYLPMKFVSCPDCGYESECLSNFITYPLMKYKNIDVPVSIYQNGTGVGQDLASGILQQLNGAPQAIAPAGNLIGITDWGTIDMRKWLDINL